MRLDEVGTNFNNSLEIGSLINKLIWNYTTVKEALSSELDQNLIIDFFGFLYDQLRKSIFWSITALMIDHNNKDQS